MLAFVVEVLCDPALYPRGVGKTGQGRMEVLLRSAAFKPKVSDDGTPLKCAQRQPEMDECVSVAESLPFCHFACFFRFSFRNDLQSALRKAFKAVSEGGLENDEAE